MSLFSTLQLASNALQAQSIGLQVTGQNISNVNTPGYARAQINLTPAPTQRLGNLLLGLGVEVDSIKQSTDAHLNERLRSALADTAGGDVREKIYGQLEAALGELEDTDISSSMNSFFSAISQILNQPESVSVRNLAILQGKTLAGDINRLASRASELRNDANDQIIEMEPEINRLLSRVADLNVKIATTEGGSLSTSDAVGLRDERNAALESLSKLIDITTKEQTSGAINVFAGGDFLVFEGTHRNVEVSFAEGTGFNAATILVRETESKLHVESGKLASLVEARDDVLGGFMSTLDNYAATLVFEFNKVFSSGQGLSGYSQITSEHGITNSTAALDAAGLAFTPVNGAFDVLIHNKQTNLTTTTRIRVDLNGLDGDDTTYAGLVAQLNAVDGLNAATDQNGRLILSSESPNVEFAFADDTSGALAALGVNTLFTGTSAASIGINSTLAADPTKFAASRTGIDGDTSNAVDMAKFLDRPLDTSDGKSIGQVYGELVAGVTQSSSVAKAVANGFRSFEDTLKGEQLAIQGVNLDEEAVNMMSFQRAYAAAARLIKAIDEMLELLTSL
jgi:flagellar hook-associated protein 1 FlgK